ncbi:MAG: redoxin domain-containing protein [Candidatus Sericytochromatia bacterium]|nr:redoxin domain-containing protein [Candidatus Tanganyikabacteria bacterium]
MRDAHPKIQARGETVAISYEDAITQKRFKDELHLPFPLLADPQYKAIDRYGGREKNNTYSKPAAFIVDKVGKIRFAYIGKDASDRPPVDLLLKSF